MGLMDVLNGMQHGPRGPSGPSTGSGGGMSPMTMAILGLLAYKTFKSFTSQTTPHVAQGAPAGAQVARPGGGLGDLLKQFQQNGQGEVAKSWVDNGPNKAISSEDLAKALGSEQIEALTA